ncbi:unnamed protein product [Euphydryas editha]|uniref:FLYWCH-type domain-containing protein n=1 Tax=Euphydryas editha TaxID=104508 RepID=A0AAU9TFL9_EUPED|nr:unnamed protein product [Euphydryas editha]
MIRLLSGKQLVMVEGFTFHSTDAHFIKLMNGTVLFMAHDYSYHKIAGVKYCGGIRWQCSSRKKSKCNAFAVLSEDQETVYRISGFHNHEPPVYMEMAPGQYMKI